LFRSTRCKNGAGPEGRILKEFLEPRLFADGLFGFPLDKLESLRLAGGDPVV